MEYKEFEGKTLDEAIASAMRELGVQFEELDIQVISEGSKGLFGIMGNKNAKILAAKAPKNQTQKGDEQKKQKPSPVGLTHITRNKDIHRDVLEEAKKRLKDILDLMNIESKISISEDNTLEIIGDGSGLIIGKRGQTLDALQFILNRIINKDKGTPVHISLDSEGYRKRHIAYLKDIAIKMGQEARRTGHPVSLEKMNPYDRRIIHITLKDDTRVNTKSVGEGIYKKVMIFPRKAPKY
ncbi:MAG: Jag N-terminal domain-containing protein [Deltaproteobacteria bacterium]|nr:Jag N-terminal domain-containing protein [Deltaproteobacteria bacterium]